MTLEYHTFCFHFVQTSICSKTKKVFISLILQINKKEVYHVKLPMVSSQTHTLTKDWAVSLAREDPSYQDSLDGVTIHDTILSLDSILCELIFVAPTKKKGGARAKKMAEKLKSSSVS